MDRIAGDIGTLSCVVLATSPVDQQNVEFAREIGRGGQSARWRAELQVDPIAALPHISTMTDDTSNDLTVSPIARDYARSALAIGPGRIRASLWP
jgi:hypothetical protein